MYRFLIFFLLLPPLTINAQRVNPDSVAQVLSSLDEPLPPARPGDWRYQNPELPQTLSSFCKKFGLDCGQTHIRIYILGAFTEEEGEMLKEAQQFMELFYNTRIELRRLNIKRVPKDAIRKTNGHKQVYTGYINSLIYDPHKESIASLAICSWDLTTGTGNAFVFGESDPLNRIGCCSMFRLKDEDRNLTLLRILKTCVHEINHILGMEHCSTHYCNMNGNNNLQEVDAHPLYLCSTCSAKLSLLNDFPTTNNATALANYCGERGWKREAEYYQKVLSLFP